MNQAGPLQGIRVLDFTHVLAGPFATMLLGDLGAEILKIEIPGRGDSTRLSGPPFQNGESAYFISHNRNKKSICIDLKKKEGVEVIKRMAVRTDVVVECFRTGVMERLGLGYEEIKKIKPDLIYGSLNAFGNKGPHIEKPGFELIIQGLTGLLNVNTEPGRRPFKVQIQIVDLCTGMFLALAIIAALHHRERTGQGQKVQTSLLESTVAMMANLVGIYFMTGNVPAGMGTRNPQVMPSQAFRTKDGYIIVVTQPQHWVRFCKALGKEEWGHDPLLSDNKYRVEHYDEVERIIEEITETKTTREWLERFEQQEVAAGPINTVEDLFHDLQMQALDMVKTVQHKKTGKIKLLAQPWRLSETPGGINLPPPVLGEHTSDILQASGFSLKEIETLMKNHIVSGA